MLQNVVIIVATIFSTTSNPLAGAIHAHPYRNYSRNEPLIPCTAALNTVHGALVLRNKTLDALDRTSREKNGRPCFPLPTLQNSIETPNRARCKMGNAAKRSAVSQLNSPPGKASPI